ncbi:MAG: substrate-binding domain-containing protein, partial [Pseudomonadota bacterium]
MASPAPFIVLQSTTSTQNSGLYDHILPIFTETSGIEVRVVAVGTGQAIRNATNGDGDVLLVHAKAAEERFALSKEALKTSWSWRSAQVFRRSSAVWSAWSTS